MADDVPTGCTRYLLTSYERFPTLEVDDGAWRHADSGMPGDEPPGFYADDRTVVLPDALFDMWKRAHEHLKVVEETITSIAEAQDRFANPRAPQ